MRCTSIEKKRSGKRLNQKLTDNCIRLLFNLLHVHVVHLSPVERVGLLPSASIAISVLQFRTIIGIVPSLPALETGNVTLILLGGCGWIRAVLIAACSIPIPILWAIMIMRTSSIVSVASMDMGKSSRVRGETRLLLSSRIVLSLSILPLAALNLLLLPFNHKSLIYQLLVVGECCHHQLHTHLIVQPFHKLLLLCGICGHIIWGIAR